jgi:nucleotide-binding universal stress UspA family protein
MIARILVASDGRTATAGALRIARLLAERSRAAVEVLAVQEPVELYAAEYPIMAPGLAPTLMQQTEAAIRDSLRDRLDETGGGAADWPVTLETGPAARILARHAAEREADLVLLGLRQPDRVERWLGRNTLLGMMHLSSVPVLAVREDASGLPRTVLAAVDFSDFSLRAARFAAECAAPDAELHLGHATGFLGVEGSSGRGEIDWFRTYRVGVEARLEELRQDLERTGRRVSTHVVAGDPGDELLALAESLGADLLATGTHGSGFFGRLMMGSVSSKLVHGARGSVLVAPPEDVASELR